ncbi:hypothetical protein CAPTEDRAFT_195045 [Capitella teleta]|uniref:Aminopeptidase n=1 Tax=Capitella teleta TaxID=283909 RepID=R7UPP0_CAPTE|nr:hypothetical protein CAPTEDRAFT_195045 [Capitella teleta]|eukprot:ELU05917.1 hypothetical protein CAPTEDRAFT_195045 [Capitella teleta]
MEVMMVRESLLLLLCFLGATLADEAVPEPQQDPNPLFNNGVAPKSLEDGRLPTAIEPVHYDLEIRPDIYTSQLPFVHNGHVTILMHAVEATNQIILNYDSLTLVGGSMRLIGFNLTDPAPSIVGWGVLPDLDFLVITLSNNLVAGRAYAFSMSFFGDMNTAAGRYGLYWDTYEENGETRYVVGSQLQTIYARRVFPVFDEPSFKATFNVTIGRKSPYNAIGNGALLYSEEVEDGWIMDHFDTTPRMSCYLLAFVVVDYGYLETVTSTGTISRLWVRDDALEAAAYGNQIIGPITEWLETYTNYHNVMPIVNHVLLPSHGGAMENWGLIIYGESTVLWDENWYNSGTRRGTASIIAHELAHFWFGNLVTCDWWSNTWLNEGFASFFDSKALEALDWPPNEIVYQGDVRGMFVSDLSSSIQPVRPDVTTPWESMTAFTTSSYAKRYLQNFEFSNAETDDLWAMLTAQAAQEGITNPDGSPLDVKNKFDPWVLQSGYPLVQAIRNYDSGDLTIFQSHFNPNTEDWPPSDFGYSWNVPVSVLTENDNDPDAKLVAWMDRVPAIVIEDAMPSNASEWYLVNPGTRFFYRVQYDAQNMANINRQLVDDHEVFDVETRAALIEDIFTFARAEILTEVDAFETSQFLKAETEGIPWLIFDSYAQYVERLLRRFPETEALFSEYIEGLIRPVYELKEWDIDWREPTYQNELQQLAVRLACKLDNADCLETNADLFELWLQLPADENPVIVGHRPSFYCTAVRTGDEADWTAIYDRYKEDAGTSHLPFDSVEKSTLLESLACSADVQVLQKYLDDLFEEDFIEQADLTRAMQSLAGSVAGRDVVWDHLMQNWDTAGVVPSGVSRASILYTVLEGFASEVDSVAFAEFAARYPPEDSEEEEIMSRASDIVAENRKWVDRNLDELHDWLSSV